MEFMSKLEEVSDTTVGIYCKAHYHCLTKGVMSYEYDPSEYHEDYLQELKETGLVKLTQSKGSYFMVLGEGLFFFYDEPAKQPKGKAGQWYRDLCYKYSLPDQTIYDPKSYSMLKSIQSRDNWEQIVEFAFSNWSWLGKTLNVSLPTINVLCSKAYWTRIEQQLNHRPTTTDQNLGNRYEDPSYSGERGPAL